MIKVFKWVRVSSLAFNENSKEYLFHHQVPIRVNQKKNATFNIDMLNKQKKDNIK